MNLFSNEWTVHLLYLVMAETIAHRREGGKYIEGVFSRVNFIIKRLHGERRNISGIPK